jgi:hypothetical protein
MFRICLLFSGFRKKPEKPIRFAEFLVRVIEAEFSVVDGRGPCWLSVVGCWLHGGFAAAAIWAG